MNNEFGTDMAYSMKTKSAKSERGGVREKITRKMKNFPHLQLVRG